MLKYYIRIHIRKWNVLRQILLLAKIGIYLVWICSHWDSKNCLQLDLCLHTKCRQFDLTSHTQDFVKAPHSNSLLLFVSSGFSLGPRIITQRLDSNSKIKLVDSNCCIFGPADTEHQTVEYPYSFWFNMEHILTKHVYKTILTKRSFYCFENTVSLLETQCFLVQFGLKTEKNACLGKMGNVFDHCI